MNINMTFANSPTPKLIKRIGSIASGGTIDINVIKDKRSDFIPGKMPIFIPISNPIEAESAMPIPRRLKLEMVSCSIRYLPLRLFWVKAILSMASTILEIDGNSLSWGFAFRRISDAFKYTAMSKINGSIARMPFRVRDGSAWMPTNRGTRVMMQIIPSCQRLPL
jgi:hypothetical protein